MGQLVTTPLDSMMKDMLARLQSPGEETKYTLEYHRAEFSLNKFPDITFYDGLLKLTIIPKFENGISIANMISNTTVNKINSRILLNINGVDHSRLANLLLNIENPRVGLGNLVDAIFLLLKEITLQELNEALTEMSEELCFLRK